MASSAMATDPMALDERPPSRSRSRSLTPRSRYSRSPSMDRGRSPPRNGRYRSRSRGNSLSRSRTPSRSRTRARSYSRERSYDSRDRSRSRSRTRSRTRSESPRPKSTKIVVERLTKNINEDHLYEIFGQYGEIDDLDLPVNRQSGINRGTAYILYFTEEEAQAAITHMHEAQLDGSVINVSIVLPRRKISPSPPQARRGPRGPPANVRSALPGFSSGGGPPGGRGGGRYGHRSDNYRPRSVSRSRSRSPVPAASGSRRYRSRSAASYSSRSRSRTPPARGGRSSRGGRNWGRGGDDYGDRDRRRSPSRDSYDSRSRSRSRSRERR